VLEHLGFAHFLFMEGATPALRPSRLRVVGRSKTS
jgi:hypothetical protein